MEPSYEFGRVVSESEAHTYVENYKALRGTLIEEVLPLTPDDASQVVKDSVTFHKSDVNAFLFDASIIIALLQSSDPPPYFAVFLGATDANPTVVVAGLYNVTSPPNSMSARPSAPPPEFPGLLHNVKYPSYANGAIGKP